MNHILKYLILFCSFFSLSGCATIEGPTDANDPFERYNRTIYYFNDNLDKYILKPVAEGYDVVTPKPVQIGISNFF